MTFNPLSDAAVICFLIYQTARYVALISINQRLYHPKGQEKSSFLDDSSRIWYISYHFGQNSLIFISLKMFALHMESKLTYHVCVARLQFC